MTGELLLAALQLTCPDGTALVEKLGYSEAPASTVPSLPWAPVFPGAPQITGFGGGGLAWCARPDGVRHGPIVGWEGDILVFSGAYADGLMDGRWTEYGLGPERDGARPRKILSEWTMRRGTGVQRWTGFRMPESEVSYRDGRLDGPFRVWLGPGPPVRTGAYRHGCRHGTWRSYRQVWWYNWYDPLKEPRLEESVTYVDGLLEGPSRWRHPDRGWGPIEGAFRRGVPDGAWVVRDRDEGDTWSQLHDGAGVLSVRWIERYPVGGEFTAREDDVRHLWLPPGRYTYRLATDRIRVHRRHGRCRDCRPSLADVPNLGVMPIESGILVDVASWADVGPVVAILDGLRRGPDATIRVVPGFRADQTAAEREPQRVCDR